MADEEKKETTEVKESWLNKALRTVLSWLKGNWLVLVVVALVVLISVKGCQADSAYQTLFNQYNESIEDHRRQLEEIRTIQEHEREEMDRQLQNFLSEMNRIEREYKEELARISETREVTRVRIIREYERDPGALTSTVRDVFGIPVEE